MSRLAVTMAEEMFEALEEVADTWGQSMAAVVRVAVQAMLDDPERLRELMVQRVGMGEVVDIRTPEQAARWEREEARLKAFDLGAVVADHRQRDTTP